MAKLTILFVFIILSSFLMSLFLTFSIFGVNNSLFYNNSKIKTSRIYILFAFVTSWISFSLLLISLILSLSLKSFLLDENCDADIKDQNSKIMLFLFAFIAVISFFSLLFTFISLMIILSINDNKIPSNSVWIYLMLSTIFGIVVFVLVLIYFFIYKSSSLIKCPSEIKVVPDIPQS